MKYRSFYLYILAITSIQLFTSCKKASLPENEKPEFTVAFSRNALEYVHLTEGKYLIYKDSVTGQVDSVIVTTSRLETTFYQKHDGADLSSWGLGYMPASPAFSSEEFTLKLTKFDGTSQTRWLDGDAYTQLPSPWASSDTAALKLSVSGSFPFTDAFYMTESMTPDHSMMVEGVQYNNVVMISHDNGYDPTGWGYSRATYYWAKAVGLIKYEFIDFGVPVKIYSLLRHN